MLLPSALSCDSSHPRVRLQPSLFTSPPTSPQPHMHNPSQALFATCRALQSMLSSPPPKTQLPTPPMTNAPLPSPLKLRLRSRGLSSTTAKTSTNGSATVGNEGVHKPRMRVVKRSVAPPPRGLNKRLRSEDEDSASCSSASTSPTEMISMQATEMSTRNSTMQVETLPAPSTPKRMRLAPSVLPLGLERSDFHHLESNHGASVSGSYSDSAEAEEVDNEETQQGEEDWTSEEDRALVELVLEKLKLSKSEWQDCARSLGKGRKSVGRRWMSLMAAGEVGIKNSDRVGRRERGRIYGTWR